MAAVLRLVTASAVVGLGAAVQGAVGFGVNLIAAPLLVLIDPSFVPAPVNLSSAVLNVMILATRRDLAPDPAARAAMVGLVPGTALAAVLVAVLPTRGLSIAFAVLVGVAVVLSASGWMLRRTPRSLFGAGAASGFMGTLSGIGGPPIALAYQHEPAAVLRGTLPRFFLVGSIATLLALGAAGAIGWHEVGLAASLLPGAAIGLWASGPLSRHLDRGTARPAVLALSSLAALSVLLRNAL